MIVGVSIHIDSPVGPVFAPRHSIIPDPPSAVVQLDGLTSLHADRPGSLRDLAHELMVAAVDLEAAQHADREALA